MPERKTAAPSAQALPHGTLQPADWPRPKGYANGIVARGDMIFVAGQVGWNAGGTLATGFVAQARQTLENIMAVLFGGRSFGSAFHWHPVEST
jgi:enamine deaminase RidA (YjgF/YER057c/UK114 family)